MAGGIFPNRPFEFNIKCIIFTIIIAGGYWYLPVKNIYILFFLLWFPYIIIAWYDYSYNCENKMKYTLFPFGKYIFLPFKPKEYQKTYTELTNEQKELIDNNDHIYGWTILIFIIFYFVRYYKENYN